MPIPFGMSENRGEAGRPELEHDLLYLAHQEVVRELEQQTGKSVAPAAVYVTLRRLEKRGLLRSRMSPPDVGTGGRERRVFEVMPEAVELLLVSRRDLDRLWDGVTVLEVQ